MASVQDILSHDQSKDQDFYQLLGCDEDSSVEQINTEYKVRALQYHPDKNNGDKEAEAKFQQLKYAKEVLCDPERRVNYDKWRKSGIAMSYQQWLGLKEHAQQSMHWTTPKLKDRMLGDGSSASSTGAAGSKQQKPVNRRASEGGANIHWSGRQQANIPWDNQPPSEVVSKFRNYEI